MPIYEYRCRACGRTSTFVTLSVSAALEPRCQHCGSADVRRLVSRVAVLRSEESRMEALEDPSSLAGLDENDPASMARWMKKMGREMGGDAGPDFEREVEDAVEAARGSENGAGEAGEGDDGGAGSPASGLPES